MIITDLNGVPIEVTDLDKALAQADSFRGYKHTDNTHKALDKRLKAYCKRYKLPFTQDDLTNLQWYDQTQCSKRSIEFEIEPQEVV